MWDVLLGISELLLEIGLEFGGEVFLDWLVRKFSRFFEWIAGTNPLLCAIAYILLGAAFGGLSLKIAPHPFFHRSALPGISLFLAPIATGLLMETVGEWQRRSGKSASSIESFRYGFAAALGMALVRFLFAA